MGYMLHDVFPRSFAHETLYAGVRYHTADSTFYSCTSAGEQVECQKSFIEFSIKSLLLQAGHYVARTLKRNQECLDSGLLETTIFGVRGAWCATCHYFPFLIRIVVVALTLIPCEDFLRKVESVTCVNEILKSVHSYFLLLVGQWMRHKTGTELALTESFMNDGANTVLGDSEFSCRLFSICLTRCYPRFSSPPKKSLNQSYTYFLVTPFATFIHCPIHLHELWTSFCFGFLQFVAKLMYILHFNMKHFSSIHNSTTHNRLFCLSFFFFLICTAFPLISNCTYTGTDF